MTGVANHSSTSMVGVVSTCPEIVFDDSGVSDVASNSTNSTGEDMALPDCHMAAKEGSQDSGSDIIACATTERWAKVSAGSYPGKRWRERLAFGKVVGLSVVIDKDRQEYVFFSVFPETTCIRYHWL